MTSSSIVRATRVTAALSLLCLASTASLAQSSVTVFGIVDLSARAVKNDQTQYQLASGGLQTSRLGLRAVEDLGGGLKAGFWLEGELQPDTGNAAGFNWQRRATVSLGGGFGELRLGRDKVPTLYNWEDFDPFKDAGVARSTRLVQAAGIVPAGGSWGTASRANNAVSYFLPEALGGLFGQATVAAGEGTLGNKYVGGRLGWRGGPATVALSYGETEVTGDVDAETWSVGGSVDFQFVRLMGFWSQLEIGSAAQRNLLLGLTVPLGANFEGRLSYQRVEGRKSIAAQEAKLFGVGGVYSLSKRTALYGSYGTIRNNAASSFTVATASALTRGKDSTGYELGLRHAF